MEITRHAPQSTSRQPHPPCHPIHPIHPPRCRAQRAYSVFDLLVTLVISGTLSSLAVPAFKQMTTRARITTQVNHLLTDLHRARSEAITRGQPVVLCSSRDGQRCSGDATWHDGWVVFVDLNGNHRAEPDETVISVQGAEPGVKIQLNASGGELRNLYFGYRPDGLSGKNGTFTFCDPTAPGLARAIIIYRTGRARVSYKTAEGNRLACPVNAWKT